jgi:hypothetical protein
VAFLYSLQQEPWRKTVEYNFFHYLLDIAFVGSIIGSMAGLIAYFSWEYFSDFWI